MGAAPQLGGKPLRPRPYGDAGVQVRQPPAHLWLVHDATRGDAPVRARQRRERGQRRPAGAVYLRRRIAAAVIVVGLVAAGWGGARAAAALAGHPADPLWSAPAIHEQRVVVAPGDTVWSLVGPLAPAGVDQRAWVAEVLAHNDIRAGTLAPGSVLRIPVR
jgi:hypothetical protein